MAVPDQAAAAAAHRARARWRMEAAVSNFLRTGDKALVIRGGKFGERWGSICQAYGIDCVYIDVEWGKSVDAKAVAAALEKNPGIRAVYATACETSTATSTTSRPSPRSCAAATTSSCASTRSPPSASTTCRWTVGASTSSCVGSQKALMLPPGLAMVAVSEKAWKANERSNLPRFYLDLGARAEEPGKGRDRVHAGRVADRRPARVAAHDEGRDAGGRLQPPRAAGQGDARGGRRPGPRAVLVVADQRRHRASACRPASTARRSSGRCGRATASPSRADRIT